MLQDRAQEHHGHPSQSTEPTRRRGPSYPETAPRTCSRGRGPAIPWSLTCHCWLRSGSPSRWPRRRSRPPPLPPVRTCLRGTRQGAHASLATRGPTSSQPRELRVETLRPQSQPSTPPAAPPFCQAAPRDPEAQLRLDEALVARETEKLPGEDVEH